jgi:prepilin-type N-terminal cleavage/methylation domain-containing protein
MVNNLYGKNLNGGFTLIEIIIVVGLLAIIAGFGLFLSMDSYRGYVFHAEQNLAISVLQKARSQAIVNIDQQPHGVYLDLAGKQYIIFEGPTHTSFPSTNIPVPFISSSISHSGMGGANEVLFNQLDASVSVVPSALHLSDSASHNSDINFNNEGQINY